VSRLPTSDAATLKSICEHLVRYGLYRGGDWGGWQNQVMLCAYASSTYETTCDDIEAKIKSCYQVIKRYAKNLTGGQDISKRCPQRFLGSSVTNRYIPFSQKANERIRDLGELIRNLYQ
jgi:hypothetical protein